jgi:hypothetical protein
MTQETVTLYSKLIDELGDDEFGRQKKRELVAFLGRSDITPDIIDALVEEYRSKIEEGISFLELVNNQSYSCIYWIEAFDRKGGTIKPKLSPQEIMERIKAYRTASVE